MALAEVRFQENVTLAVQAASPQLNRRSAQEHAQYFIDLVKLTAATTKRPHELSGGMRQRVAFARALAMEPRLLLLNEPLSALDALTRATLQDELARIWGETKTTVIMVSNDIDEAILLADRVYPLTRGPRATLGQPIPVVLPRPRTRTRLSLVPEYQHVHREIVAFLEGLRDQRAGLSEKEKDQQPTCNTAPQSLAPTPPTPMNPRLIELWRLRKEYPTPSGSAVIVKDFTLIVHEGEFVCIIGHSGCGKSTVLSMMMD